MSPKDDDKLFWFLREHSARVPDAPENERARIAARITERPSRFGWRVMAPVFGVMAAAAALLFIDATQLRVGEGDTELGELAGFLSEESLTGGDDWIAMVDGLIDEN